MTLTLICTFASTLIGALAALGGCYLGHRVTLASKDPSTPLIPQDDNDAPIVDVEDEGDENDAPYEGTEDGWRL